VSFSRDITLKGYLIFSLSQDIDSFEYLENIKKKGILTIIWNIAMHSKEEAKRI